MKKGALTGLLLFGMFFGAGNLIFPPALGVLSGENFWPAILGFVVSGVGIAVIALIVGTLNPKGYVHEISRKISPAFATVYLVALYLAIGPFFAIPRTATTSFEIGIAPLLGDANLGLWLFGFTALYFVAAYLIALNPSQILNSIGRILTPVFAILIVILVVLGIVKYGSTNPLPAADAYSAGRAFGTGFIEGYNTLDALASIAFSVVAVNTLKQLGFSSKKEYVSTIWSVGFVVALAFSALYVGLAFLGNHFPVPADVLASKEIHKGVYVLSQATQAIFGPSAQIFLAAMVIVTCFTTTVGLIVSSGEFFAERFSRFNYKVYATLFTLIGFGIANLGLSKIIAFSIPVLLILYPITICIILITIVNKFVPLSTYGMQLTVGLVTALSLVEVLAGQFNWTAVSKIISALPLAGQSLAWLLPALVGIVLSLFLPNKQESEVFEMKEK
ncbi:TPA: branched-chain amino acid transport system II carrier protein [Streptococcus suis]|uniref:Branched-chain amino acid transport system carrier protein n=2 Tax=Streptococcus suis TaxID=1307 RepID=A0AAP6A517_STRSU|nr:branched-chain amino acid transport system II carrier protein [Streptococcus suis]MCB2907647.1 branched-chain amino acid transport system II carrier protein [Streptococcus suis]MDW8591810.1 branched-chain amino acid transport system II carrier protein [Streptococcus suis]MDW8601801.1 branched-chain amino acid transport system II carrier protein [Streptococcus suis]MDW8624453.1 branched-chain amino acid transport system II carrier protein [Streptococcus suis]MDW8632176.1 branched-chain amino